MDKPYIPDNDTLDAYLLGLLEDAETAQVEAWLATDEEAQMQLDARREVLATLDSLESVDVPHALAARTIDKLDEAQPKTWSWWALRIGGPLVAMACIALILLPALSRSRGAAQRASMANTMKQWGLVFKMYANESKAGLYPPFVETEAGWVPDLRVLYPEYITDLSLIEDSLEGDQSRNILEMPRTASAPVAASVEDMDMDWERLHLAMAQNMIYTGYALEDPALVEPLLQQSPLDQDSDVIIEDSRTIPRLKEGVERFFITDINNPAGSASAQSSIPILIQRQKGPHEGYLVLFMDGSVQYIRGDEATELLKAIRNAHGMDKPPE